MGFYSNSLNLHDKTKKLKDSGSCSKMTLTCNCPLSSCAELKINVVSHHPKWQLMILNFTIF